jgi:hypothetical protein
MFELPLLPAAYIDNSLLTAVLMGVFVLWWLTERFGWPATGLVVPGYLAAVLVVRPEAAAVIGVEAVLTYLIAHVLGRLMHPLPFADRVFGRDRFFLIILASVLVRMFVEGAVVRDWLTVLGFELGPAWHSLGLVLVPLTANTFWKPGLLRGVPATILPILVVYAMLVLVVIPFTNFNLSEFELTYEDLTWSFVDAPREYILVLLGAFMASYTTHRFGWDFGGIIVCGLLAISWLDPLKLAATLAEILTIVLAMRFLLTRWPLRTANVSGLRPIVLAFTLSWTLKFLLSWVFQEAWPGFRVGELFGFGYLLPAIVGVRCYRLGSVSRVLLPALGISLATAVIGLGVGQALVSLRTGVLTAAEVETAQPSQTSARRRVVQTVGVLSDQGDQPLESELQTALVAARAGVAWRGRRVQVDVAQDGAVVHSGDTGLLGSIWIRKEGRGELEIQVPDAMSTPGLAEAGVTLAEALGADILLLSPSKELRRRTHESGRKVLLLRAGEATRLDADGRLPDEIELGPLTELLPDTPTGFHYTGLGDAVLTLSDLAVLELALDSFDQPVGSEHSDLWDEDGYPRATDVEPRGAVRPLDLALLDRGVLKPMLLARVGDHRWLRVAQDHALSMGLVLSEDDHIISLGPLDERDPPRFTLELRKGGEPFAIEVRAAGRHHLAVEAGRSWARQLDAAVLLVHDARADLDAEAIRRAGGSAPELAILRDMALGIDDLLVLSLSASREDEVPQADAVISVGRPVIAGDRVPEGMYRAAALVHRSGGSWVWYDGDAHRIRFYDPSNPRREAVRAAGGQFVTVYLSPTYRLLYAGLERGSVLRQLVDHAGLRVGAASLEELLEAPRAEQPADHALLLEDLHLFQATRHPGALQRLQVDAAAQGLDAWVFTDPQDGLSYLVVDGEQRWLAPIFLAEDRPTLAPEWVMPPELPVTLERPEVAP